MVSLGAIDWSADKYSITESAALDLSSDATVGRETMIRSVARTFEQQTDHPHYVYCYKYEEDGEDAWYVGETMNLAQRFATHINTRGMKNIEVIEGVANEDVGKDREHELHLDIAREKPGYRIYGGH